MAGLGAPELIIVLVIVMLLFGSRKLPELANSMGRSIKEFRRGSDEAAEDDPSALAEEPPVEPTR